MGAWSTLLSGSNDLVAGPKRLLISIIWSGRLGDQALVHHGFLVQKVCTTLFSR